jgi:hypothetical protein
MNAEFSQIFAEKIPDFKNPWLSIKYFCLLRESALNLRKSARTFHRYNVNPFPKTRSRIIANPTRIR